ncbi:MAG: acetyl-CoA carboxylase carboxyl transferase subunit beta [Alphaproteobacteria bacterium]|nr:acetyl-CoA carboxylase carboxyl transferase subunit beta [Alphaproteobacteria bacterium]
MNWLTNLPPGLKSIFSKKADTDKESLWVKCPKTGELLYREDLEAAMWVTPAGAHMRVSPEQRFKYMFDGGLWTEIPMPPVEKDPLKFKDDKRYIDRLKSAKAKTGREDCMVAAFGEIGGRRAVILVQDFAFMGGSLGMAAGEAFIKAAETAVSRRAALIVVTASGGARMQESSFALMQMPRTVLAIQDVKEAKLPYIVILADPTSGGVLASYAMLGDVHIAEPGAQLAFTGPRVIEQTIREKLPEGFQRSEFLRERGMVDIVAPRRELAGTLADILGILMPAARGRKSRGGAGDYALASD